MDAYNVIAAPKYGEQHTGDEAPEHVVSALVRSLGRANVFQPMASTGRSDALE